MHVSRLLLAAVGVSTFIAAALPQAPTDVAPQRPIDPPRNMHLCAGGRCQMLSWNDGHYDARFDGETEVVAIFGVVRWDREGIDFMGVVTNPNEKGEYLTGIFTGVISPDGNSVEAGIDSWRVGGGTGKLPFSMTWNPSDQVKTVSSRRLVNLPPSLRLCAETRCVTLKLHGGNYDVYEESNLSTKTATYLVASFSPDSVFLELLVPNGLRAIATGKILGSSLVNGRLTWLNAFNGVTSPIRAAWGSSLASVKPEYSETVSTISHEALKPSPFPAINHGCPVNNPDDDSVNAFDAWQKGEALLHIEGDGPARTNWGHQSEALIWLCKAAAAGSPNAATEIGDIFARGYAVNSQGPNGEAVTRHIPSNRAISFDWYQYAANLGYTRAMFRVAKYYFWTDAESGVRKDVAKGLDWATRAADAGDTDALMMLALNYAPGVVPTSPVQQNGATAFKYYAMRQTSLMRHKGKCEDPNVVSEMKAELPPASSNRVVKSVDIDAYTNDLEIVCVLNIEPPPIDQNETALSEIFSVGNGSSVSSWAYDVDTDPHTKKTIVRRETFASHIDSALIKSVTAVAIARAFDQ